MKGFLSVIFSLICLMVCIGCSGSKTKAIELMGAGDKIHDTFTFANIGVEIKEKEENIYEISGSVEKITDENVKDEFDIDEDVTHVVAIKLTAVDSTVLEEKVKVYVDGSRAYDAEHLNGSNYTFIILEAKPGALATVNALWDGENEKVYTVKFNENLTLK